MRDHDGAPWARLSSDGISTAHSVNPLAHNYRQVLCAVLYRAVKDLELSNQQRVDKARQWLQSERAAEMAELAGVATGDQLDDYVESTLE